MKKNRINCSIFNIFFENIFKFIIKNILKKKINQIELKLKGKTKNLKAGRPA